MTIAQLLLPRRLSCHRAAVGIVLISALGACTALPEASRGTGSPAPASRLGLVREVAIADDPVLSTAENGIGAVAVGPAGQLIAVARLGREVRIFDSTGKPMGSIGLRAALASMGFVGDSMWTSVGGRFTFFSSDGLPTSWFTARNIIDSATIDTQFRYSPARVLPSSVLADGTLFFGGISLLSDPILRRDIPIVRVIGTREGGILRGVAPSYRPSLRAFEIRGDGPRSFYYDQTMDALVDTSALVAVGGNGEWLALVHRGDCGDRGHYRVSRTSLAGDTLWKTTLPCPRIPFPPSFVDSVVVLLRESSLQLRRRDVTVVDSAARPWFHMVKAFTPVRALVVGADGTLWIRPLTGMRESHERWIRADAQRGSPSGFTLPPGSELKAVADARRIWVAERDLAGRNALVRYRLSTR